MPPLIICPICESDRTTDLGPPVYRHPTTLAGRPIDLSDLGLRWNRCSQCEFQWLEPGIPQDRLIACYAAASTGHWETDGALAGQRYYGDKKRLIDRFSPGKRVLDFGCFDGGFLKYLGDGYEKLGIEPAQAPARAAEANGVQIVSPTIEALDPARIDPVDAVISLDVFEHLTDPIGTLRALTRLLRPGGILLIETGDTDTPVWREVGKRYIYAGHVEHVALWNRRSIEAAGNRVGLSLVEFRPSEHRVVKLHQRLNYALRRQAWRILWGWDSRNLPLPTRLRSIARAPMPRGVVRDHFLAVLRLDTPAATAARVS